MQSKHLLCGVCRVRPFSAVVVAAKLAARVAAGSAPRRPPRRMSLAAPCSLPCSLPAPSRNVQRLHGAAPAARRQGAARRCGGRELRAVRAGCPMHGRTRHGPSQGRGPGGATLDLQHSEPPFVLKAPVGPRVPPFPIHSGPPRRHPPLALCSSSRPFAPEAKRSARTARDTRRLRGGDGYAKGSESRENDMAVRPSHVCFTDKVCLG